MTTGDALGRMDSDTDAADPDTDDPDTLRERVADLEATVAAQQQTITRMLPGRRGVLKAGALLGGGALVGAGTADRASAQAAGQVGTSSDPVDVEAYDLAVQHQLSSNLDAGGNDLTNVGSLKTNQLSTSQGTLWDRANNDPFDHLGGLTLVNEPSSTSSTNFTTLANASGVASLADAPAAASVQGRMIFRSGPMNDDADVRPRVINSAGDFVSVDELQVRVDSNEEFTVKDTGWTNITDASLTNEVIIGANPMGRSVGGGSVTPVRFGQWGVSFRFALD